MTSCASYVWEKKRKETTCGGVASSEKKAKGVDAYLASISPDSIANTMLIGVAAAMCGDPRRPFRGRETDESCGQETKELMGCGARPH